MTVLNKKRNIALVYGGDSLEWEISVLSGRNVAWHLNRKRYDVYEILLRGSSWRVVKTPEGDLDEGDWGQINKADFSFVHHGEKVRFDVALMMIHGAPGENGVLPSYFEAMRIPYTTSSSYVSALTFDKYACKCHLLENGIQMAKDVVVSKGTSIDLSAIVETLGLPLFVKPNSGGSSFGAAKATTIEELATAITRALDECPTVLVEEYIAGRELTNGMLKTSTQTVTLPVTEIVSKNDFFDYQAKYQGASEEITPAPIPDALRNKVQRLTSKIYDLLGCNGFIRVDYIVRGTEVVFLEVNTIPGMTRMSLVPQQVAASGMKMETFLELLIEDAVLRLGH